jgi:hypothetical protein
MSDQKKFSHQHPSGKIKQSNENSEGNNLKSRQHSEDQSPSHSKRKKTSHHHHSQMGASGMLPIPLTLTGPLS